MPTVVIALGSNLGDRRLYLLRAIEQLKAHVSIVRMSSMIETEPVNAPPPKYLNMVIVGHTRVSPEKLLKRMLSIEEKLGRRRPAPRNAPRTIDLDLIIYDAVRMRTPALTLPHPRATQRAFVVEPLREVWSASSALLT
jgi:2-amino-4-hydroxy-6-hydroxymethyldihydropteridine diphosphokinase